MIHRDLIKGIFLLVVAVCGNFVAETLGCQTQKLLSNNMFAKQFVILLTIYFALDFTNEDIVSPVEHIKTSVIVWTLFLLFTKMNLVFTIITFGLILVSYVSGNFIDYYQATNADKRDYNVLENIEIMSVRLAVATTVFGFIFYFFKQYREKRNFSITKFLFGVPKCDSI